MRYDRKIVDRSRDGITLDCQGLDPFTLFMAKVLPTQSRATSDEYWVTNTRDVHTATAPAYGVIRVADVDDQHDRIAGGRLLQRAHLQATAAGLGVHHMNQITECIARDEGLGRPDRFAGRWQEILGFDASEGLLSFRVGYPLRDTHPSPRRDLTDVLA